MASDADTTPTHSTYITAFGPIQEDSPYHPNSLETTARIITLISKSETVPVSEPYVDASCSLVPFPYLMTPVESVTSGMLLSLADLRRLKALTPEQNVFVDLKIGEFLAKLHGAVQNDWFGMPSVKDPVDPSYSWQETFTLIFETILSEAESRQSAPFKAINYTDIRGALSRAIAFFLFDDVEVPSLIWLTGSDEDIYLKTKPIPEITAILPSVGYAVWGDPLLEAFFIAPTEALLEGYRGGGGEDLTIFPRQKTKRLWYTLFLALLVLLERGEESFMGKWALEKIATTSHELKTAPCY